MKLAGIVILALAAAASAQRLLPTGQALTPAATPGAVLQPLNPHLADDPAYTAGFAVTSLLSPDGRTLLVLTSGYNVQYVSTGRDRGKRNPADSNEYVFVFDVTGATPRQTQVIQVPNAYSGLAFAPDGKTFFASGGDDDCVYVYAASAGSWQLAQTVALGHARGLGSRGIKPEVAGLAVSADGETLVAANYENDSITILARGAGGWAKSSELDLRPGGGVAGGEFPYWVAIAGNATAYVSSERDREVDVVSLAGPAPRVTARISTPGQPNRMVLDRSGAHLYVSQDNADTVAVIATATRKIEAEIPLAAPLALFPDKQHYFGINPNSLALSPGESTLYVTNGGENAVAVVRLQSASVTGLLPTAWYPNSVSVSHDGRTLYIVNGKSDDGGNPDFRRGLTPALHRDAQASNEYVLQMEKASLETVPIPRAATLAHLTRQVIANNHYLAALSPAVEAKMAQLQQRIHHVIYIVKENRTYDQVLGDLKGANGDPKLVEFPEANTPNFHALARDFVTFDNFECSGEVSGVGWPWSTSARSTDVDEKEIPPNYADRGLSYDTEGENRGLRLNERHSSRDLLPGPANVAAPDGDDDDGGDVPGQGYLWDDALRHHLTVRNYGFWAGGNYAQSSANAVPELTDPAATHTRVAWVSSDVLAPLTDNYFRGFDQTFPDYYRYTEWAREFDAYAAQGSLPNLELVRLEHDHFGNFGDALAGLNTPEMQIADDDYAVALLIQKVAHSKFSDSTLVVVVEDDAQNGGDHVDSHRSPVFIIGPYVRHHAVVSSAYTTVSLLRTIESVLGLPPLNLNDASAPPMADAFDLAQRDWDYTAVPSRYLSSSTLPIPHAPGSALVPTRTGAWWARQTRGMDFSVADHLDSAKFNHIVWTGLKAETKPQ